jgi:5-methylcytosine-specific restriction enzyme A
MTNALRYCTVPGCRTLVPSGKNGRCYVHRPPPWERREPPPDRVRGRELQRRRRIVFDREPRCVVCLAAGHARAATELDHIVPLAEGGADDYTNLQGLCHDCHERKTAAEAERGRLKG